MALFRQQVFRPVLGGVPWGPARLFLSGEQGVWYDPSDLSTMYQDSAGTTPAVVNQPVGLILDKSGNGNHATQATTANKPVLSARVNLLVKTEQLNDGSWSAPGITVSAQGDRWVLTKNDTLSSRSVNQSVGNISVAGASYSYTADYYAGTSNKIEIGIGAIADNGSGIWGLPADVSAQVLSGPGTVSVNASALAQVTGLDATIPTRVRVTRKYNSNGLRVGPYMYPDFSSSVTNGASNAVRHPQMEVSTTATRYQRVNTDTDYDTVGFPHYGLWDRIDDSIVSAAGGGGTTGILICAGIRAGGAGSLRTIWSDRGTNTGYRLSVNTSNQLVLSAGNGSAHTEVVGPTITAGTDYVVMGWHDGTNLHVRVNLAAATSAAFATATAGTASFTIGRDNGGTGNPYGDRIYGLVYRRNDASTSGERDDLTTYLATLSGVSL